MSAAAIHPTAIISPKAELGKDVQVDAYAVIGAGVRIGDSTVVKHHATIDKNTIDRQELPDLPILFPGYRSAGYYFQG